MEIPGIIEKTRRRRSRCVLNWRDGSAGKNNQAMSDDKFVPVCVRRRAKRANVN
jgi:hypothetical protein